VEPILVALSLSRQSPGVLDAAIEEAKTSKQPLLAAFILETDVLSSAFNRLGDSGIVGEKPGRQLEAALVKEYRQKGYQILDELQKKAKQEAVACRTLVESGEFVGTVNRLAKTEKASLVVVKGVRRSALGRILFGCAEADLQEKAPCPIRVVYD
jgi:nucleotide-binding universal stress UspA family protein